jgi:hypothetical protein
MEEIYIGEIMKIEIFEKIKPGLEKYQIIMERLHKVDVSKDEEFQKAFNGFYRMRQRPKEYYIYYFSLMEQLKNREASFELILRQILDNTGRCEASFSSKMLATLCPDKPIWDKYVLENLKLKIPYSSDKNRIEKTIQLYNEIAFWYTDNLKSEESRELLQKFDCHFPNIKISSTKKIDFILWQTR